jgi:hypothetical protein
MVGLVFVIKQLDLEREIVAGQDEAYATTEK